MDTRTEIFLGKELTDRSILQGFMRSLVLFEDFDSPTPETQGELYQKTAVEPVSQFVQWIHAVMTDNEGVITEQSLGRVQMEPIGSNGAVRAIHVPTGIEMMGIGEDDATARIVDAVQFQLNRWIKDESDMVKNTEMYASALLQEARMFYHIPYQPAIYFAPPVTQHVS